MADSTPQSGSLGDEITRRGDQSQAEAASRPNPGGSRSVLGDLETGTDSRSSLSGLADLGEEEEVDRPHEIVDLAARYELGEVLGRGGMGEVIRAVDRRLRRPVAIKRMRADLGASRSGMRRFLTEAVSVAALNHINVVQIHDYGHTAEGPFLVMELVDGQTLAGKLADGPLPLEEAVELMEQLCDGLQAAHDRGIVHRDIKPANILLTSGGIPRLTDFGLAKDVADSGHTQAGAVLGTLDYMPPEQKADSSLADERSDQWSLAATCYQMVTGESPRVIDTETIPEAVRDVLRRALKANPGERFESVRELGRALQDAAAGYGNGALQRSKLLEGQCTGCGTVNSVDRQFCRDCGSSLAESCPECGADARVWERFCGSCGADIQSALSTRIEEAKQRVREVQSLHSGHRWAEALMQIVPLLNAEHPALHPQRDWAKKFRVRIRREEAAHQAHRDRLLSEAGEQHSAGNYAAALQILDRIPESLRNEAAERLASRCSRAAREVREQPARASRTKSFQQSGGMTGRMILLWLACSSGLLISGYCGLMSLIAVVLTEIPL